MPVYSPSGGGSVHIDRALTQISIGWTNNQAMAGAALFPSVTVLKQTDKYYIFGREGWLPETDFRAPGAAAQPRVRPEPVGSELHDRRVDRGVDDHPDHHLDHP